MWVSKEFYFFVRWGCFNFFWVGLCVAKVWFSVKEQRKCQPNKSRPKDLFEFVCLVVFESVFCCRVGSLRLLPTSGYMHLCTYPPYRILPGTRIWPKTSIQTLLSRGFENDQVGSNTLRTITSTRILVQTSGWAFQIRVDSRVGLRR